MLSKGAKSLDEEPDVRLAHDALPGTIKTIDSFLAAAPEHPVFLELTAKAYMRNQPWRRWRIKDTHRGPMI